MKIFLIKTTTYSIITISLIIIFNSYFTSNRRYDWGEWQDFQNRLSYLKENTDEYNTVFIGSSKIRHHINPIIFDSITKTTTSYNLGSNGMFVPTSFAMAERIITDTTLALKYIILEYEFINDIRRYTHTQKSYYWISGDYLKFTIKSILYSNLSYSQKLSLTHQYLVAFFDKYLSIGKFSFRFKRTYNTPSEFEIQNNGYMSLDYQLNNTPSEGLIATRRNFMEDTSKLIKIQKNIISKHSQLNDNKPFEDKIRSLLNKAEENDIQLFFLMQQNNNLEQINSTFKTIPENNKIDLTMLENLYYVRNHFDNAHLNNNGAKIFSEILATHFLKKKK